jgi:diguanylate cyclase (GGDEF)-like protein/PAS domain S-box-containing protein
MFQQTSSLGPIIVLIVGITGLVYRLARRARRPTPQGRDLQAIVARSPDALMRFDADLRCTFASPSAAQLFGRPSDSLVGQPLGFGLADDACLLVEAAAARARDGEEDVEAVFRSSGDGPGDVRWVEARLARASDDGSLIAVLRDVSARKSDELALRAANAELNRLAGMDGLTRLANRRHFDQMLDSACRRASRHALPVSLLLVEFDGLETADEAGLRAGEECLQQAAAALRAVLTETGDLAARFGGAEFAVMLPGRDSRAALACADRIREAVVAYAIPLGPGSEEDEVVTASIGCATAEPSRDTHAVSGARLIAEADRALFEDRRGKLPKAAAAPDAVARTTRPAA